jgi:hypothetical protein
MQLLKAQTEEIAKQKDQKGEKHEKPKNTTQELKSIEIGNLP